MILWHIGTTIAIVWFVMRGNTRIDYRVVAVASLLPSLIDVPIGRIVFASRFDSGRLYGHTLLVNAALFCVLFFMRGRLKRVLVLIPTASLLHLAEDAMWAEPRVFWWPMLGTVFPRHHLPGGRLAFLDPFNYPGALWKEAIGLALIAWVLAAHGLLTRPGVRSFLRTGMLERVA